MDRVIGDQCHYGQATAQGDLLKTAIGWMSNSPAILEQLKRRCRGRNGFCSDGRRHGLTSGQAAREAAAYPFRLCRAILVGMRNELARTGHLTHGMLGYQAMFHEDLMR